MALEVLSRLVVRLSGDFANNALDIGLECYKADRVAQHFWLGPPLGNLLERAWEALPKEYRAIRALDMLAAPMAGLDNFDATEDCPDPGHFISVDDLPYERTSSNEEQFREVVVFLIRGLLGNDEARKRATFRLLPLVMSNSLTAREYTDVANSLWRTSDPILQNTPAPNSHYDWVYLILPEVEEGQSERSFRQKWFSRKSQSQGPEIASVLLRQVGAAVSGLRKRGRPF